MKKLASSLTNMLLVLTLVSAVAAFLLAYVNNVTSTTIAKINEEALSAGIKSVLSVGADEEITTTEKDVDGFVVYEVTRDSAWIGTAVKSTDKSGFGGDIVVLVGFNAEGAIQGYEVLSHAETPGLGARAGEWFRTATSSEVKKVGVLSKVFFGNPDPAGSHNIIGRDIAQGELDHHLTRLPQCRKQCLQGVQGQCVGRQLKCNKSTIIYNLTIYNVLFMYHLTI